MERGEDTGRANSQETSLGPFPSFLLVKAGELYEPGVISPHSVTPAGAPTSAVSAWLGLPIPPTLEYL